VPHVSAGKVAGVAAAAAALTTLADPDHAKRIQETRGGERVEKSHQVHEDVPEDVLARSEAESKANANATAEGEDEGSAEGEAPPCEGSRKPVTAEDGKAEDKDTRRVELLPVGTIKPGPKPCKPTDNTPPASTPSDVDHQ
jgi:hypothetical protein